MISTSQHRSLWPSLLLRNRFYPDISAAYLLVRHREEPAEFNAAEKRMGFGVRQRYRKSLHRRHLPFPIMLSLAEPRSAGF